MFTYRLHAPDGDDLGEATYAQVIHPGDEIIASGTRRYRVLDVVPITEDEDSPYAGLLQVEVVRPVL